MKLNTPDREVSVTHRHDFVFIRPCRFFQFSREAVWVDNQGVITGCGKGVGHAQKNLAVKVMDRRSFSMHAQYIDAPGTHLGGVFAPPKV